MPVSLPRVEVGGWVLVSKVASPRVMAGADVVPWRAQRGIYVVIEHVTAGVGGESVAPGKLCLPADTGEVRAAGASCLVEADLPGHSDVEPSDKTTAST